MIKGNRQVFGTKALCDAFTLPRSSFYRSQKPVLKTAFKHRSPRRIVDEKRSGILSILNSRRFCDRAPAEIYATLLDEGTYLCAVRTMYRILKEKCQNRLRRQREPRNLTRPELLANKPNQLWSWDVTKLKSPFKWTYFYLYKILDVFSRYVVGWTVSYSETAEMAKALIGDTCLKQEIIPDTLTVHGDNGSIQTAHTVGQLLIDLCVAKTHSRPHVSNDNPYSESAFKTLKYHPEYPGLFGSIEDATSYCRDFFRWYNCEHRHSGIAMLTPEQVHYGEHEKILTKREIVLQKAFVEHPERFVKGMPKVQQLPENVWINKPDFKEQNTEKVSLNKINNVSHFC